MALLDVQDLNVVFNRRGETPFTAVNKISFTVEPGQTVGLVGESGCGKSVTSLAIMGLLPRRGNKVSGQVFFEDTDLLKLSRNELRDRRGRDIGMIFQDPLSSLNPVIPIGLQVSEVLRRHQGKNKKESERGARELLEAVGIPGPAKTAEGVPAPDLRRDAPARPDRDRPRMQAPTVDRRRTDDRARRHHSGADPHAAQAVGRRVRYGARHDHSRSRGGRRPV